MPFAPRPQFLWQLRTRSLQLGLNTAVMGILNLTPDSFSDGGHFLDPEKAIAHAFQMLDEGAQIIDIGGESTRPNASPITPEEELKRVIPVLAGIHRSRPEAILSIDTYHAATAKAAVEAGAEIVNDVSGHSWDPAMSLICRDLACGVILMHTRGTPQQWRDQPSLPPDELIRFVFNGLRNQVNTAHIAGIHPSRIVLDPGFSFGKRGTENYALHARLDLFQHLGTPLLTGTSRKGYLAQTLTASPTLAPRYAGNPPSLTSRMHATLASNVANILAGAHILRVHDVRPAAESAAIADAILAAAELTLG